MKLLAFDVKDYERPYLEEQAKAMGLQLECLSARLDSKTLPLCHGHKAISCFVNDELSSEVLKGLEEVGVELIALRCAGYNNVDGEALQQLKLQICRVPEYSPQSVAEFSLALLINLTRKVHKSFTRTREMNFTLNGLVGFDLKDKTIGIVGTGRIGSSFAKLLSGFGAIMLAHDPQPEPELESLVRYVALEDLFIKSDIVVLHAPLNKNTHHMINSQSIEKMKSGLVLVNTSRGGLVETSSLIRGLKSKKIGAAALDVYEEESEFFFKDFSERILDDDTLARLMTFPNVIITSHQGYLTENALIEISATVCKQVSAFHSGDEVEHRL